MTSDTTAAPATTTGTPGDESKLLPDGFQPGENEVIIGRGKKVTSHSGNKRFREVVAAELFNYSQAPSKTEKSYILAKILHQVRRWSKEKIGFVKQDPKTGRWTAPKDSVARVTVAQAFRDALSNRYSSSKSSKQRKRQIAKGYMDDDSEEDASEHGYITAKEDSTPEVQTAAMSLRSFVHQGMRAGYGRTAGAGAGVSVQDTMAQIRNLIHCTPGSGQYPAAESLRMMNHPGMPGMGMGAMSGMGMTGMGMHMHMNSMQQLQATPQHHFGMTAALQRQGQVSMMGHMGHIAATAQDLFEPLPIEGEQLELQNAQLQQLELQNAQLHQQQQQQLAMSGGNPYMSYPAKPAQANTDDAFSASEQTSAFFLSTGGPIPVAGSAAGMHY